MDTLKKAYTKIKGDCDKHKKEISQLNDEEFKVMTLAIRPKLATRFERSWYDYVGDYCPPRSCKKMRKQGEMVCFLRKTKLVFTIIVLLVECDGKGSFFLILRCFRLHEVGVTEISS